MTRWNRKKKLDFLFYFKINLVSEFPISFFFYFFISSQSPDLHTQWLLDSWLLALSPVLPICLLFASPPLWLPSVVMPVSWCEIRGPQCLDWRFFSAHVAKKYTSDHEWISVDNGVGTFGITDFAQKALGDVVFVETPAVGDVVEKEGKFCLEREQRSPAYHSAKLPQLEQVGAIESVKAASDIYSPVSGEIVNVNEALSDEPSLINSSPEEDGRHFVISNNVWICTKHFW